MGKVRFRQVHLYRKQLIHWTPHALHQTDHVEPLSGCSWFSRALCRPTVLASSASSDAPPHTPESESAFSPDHLHPQLLRCLLKFEKHWCCSFHPSSLPWSTREHCTFVSNNTWEKVCGTDAALILSFAEYKYPLLIPPPPQKLTYMYCQFYNVYNLVHLAFIKLIVLALIFFLCLKIICSLTIPSVLVLMLGRKNSDL